MDQGGASGLRGESGLEVAAGGAGETWRRGLLGIAARRLLAQQTIEVEGVRQQNGTEYDQNSRDDVDPRAGIVRVTGEKQDAEDDAKSAVDQCPIPDAGLFARENRCLVIAPSRRVDLLRAELGRDADEVSFVDDSVGYAPQWNCYRVLLDFAAKAPGVRSCVVAEQTLTARVPAELVDYRRLSDRSLIGYAIVVLGLVAVWQFGAVRGGARRWISLGGVSVQPSEFARLAVALVLAAYYGENRRSARTVGQLFAGGLIVLIPALLIYRQPDLPLLAYSMHDEQLYAERAVRAGARGYLMKEKPPETLLEAISVVLSGRTYLSPEISQKMIGRLAATRTDDDAPQSVVSKLSDRELEVLQLIGQGMSTSRIAEDLCLSVKTIETYREHLKSKLSLRNAPELVRFAVEWSLKQA